MVYTRNMARRARQKRTIALISFVFLLFFNRFKQLVYKLQRNKRSVDLADKMKRRSGFTPERVRFHQKLAQVFEEIRNICHQIIRPLLKNCPKQKRNTIYYICGSFIEGWGFNLTELNGRLTSSSDVDTTRIFTFNRVHFADCDCKDKTGKICDMTAEGHVTIRNCYAPKSSPALKIESQSCKPPQDLADGLPCPCLPKESVIQENSAINVNADGAFTKHGVHLVEAQRPGHECEEFRISYSFLERQRFYQMNPVLGMVFVILKYIIKHELQEYGLKSYHAKTLAFHLAKKYEDQELQESQLEELTVEALLILEKTKNGNLEHAFHAGGKVYAKDALKSDFVHKIEEIIADIANVLTKFGSQLKPVTNEHYAQPFSYLLFADLWVFKLLLTDKNKQEEIFNCLKNPHFTLLPYKVYAYMYYLTSCDQNSSEWDHIKSIRDAWFIDHQYQSEFAVKQIIAIITAVRFGRTDLAKQYLVESLDLKFTHLEFKFGSDSEMREHIGNHFKNHNSVWLFPVHEDSLKLLPTAFQQLEYEEDYNVINLRAVLNWYRCQYLSPHLYSLDIWYQELQEELQSFIDWQDVHTLASSSTSLDQLLWAVPQLKSLTTNELDMELNVEIIMKARSIKNSSDSIDIWFQELQENPLKNWHDVYAFARTATSLEHLLWAVPQLKSLIKHEWEIQRNVEIIRKVRSIKNPSDSMDIWFQELQEDPLKDWHDVYAFAWTATTLDHLKWAEWAQPLLKSLSRQQLHIELNSKITKKIQKIKTQNLRTSETLSETDPDEDVYAL